MGEKKAQAVVKSLQDDSSYLQQIEEIKVKKMDEVEAEQEVKKFLETKLQNLGYANEKGKVPPRKVNRFFEESQTSAVVAAADLVDASASRKKKQLALKQALESTGMVVKSMAQVAEIQARGAANSMASVLESGSCKDVARLNGQAKSKCEAEAKSKAEKTMGRPLRTLEFKRLRTESAVAAAAKLREDCNPKDQTCKQNLMAKLRTLTGNSRLTAAKAEQFVQRGVQRAAASDMQSCLARGSDSRTCRTELTETVKGSLGRKSLEVQEVQNIVRSGGFNTILKKISACREAAETPADKADCRSRQRMASLYKESTGSNSDSATKQVEIERETNKLAFTEAANAAKDLPEKEFKKQLLEELEEDTGMDLSSNEFKFQNLLNEASA